MPARETLPTGYLPDLGHQFVRETAVACRVGRLRVISDSQRRVFAEAAAERATEGEAPGIVTMGVRSATARGLDPGFYRDLHGGVRHVQDQRDDIVRDASTLRAADAGLIQLSDGQRQFMEQRVDMLAEWDAYQSHRMGGGAIPPSARTGPGA